MKKDYLNTWHIFPKNKEGLKHVMEGSLKKARIMHPEIMQKDATPDKELYRRNIRIDMNKSTLSSLTAIRHKTAGRHKKKPHNMSKYTQGTNWFGLNLQSVGWIKTNPIRLLNTQTYFNSERKKMKSIHLMMLAAALSLSAFQQTRAQQDYSAPALPSIPDKIFNIRNYGAISDASTDNTEAIQKTINAALDAGGGQVVVPAGTYLCGPLKFGSVLRLQIDSAAVLRFLPIDRYPGGLKEGISFISGTGLHDLAITGKGTIDGQGSPWWPYAKTDKNAKRPRMIVLRDCDKILIENIHLTNSPMFHIAIGGKTTNVTVSAVTVRAPASDDPVNPSHNTDACNVTGHKILIKNCDISTGDDNYTCGGGTSDVLITGCKYGYGHGVSVGSPTAGGVSNITVENCTFTNTECGIRLKSDRDRGGIVQNLTYRNLKMTNVEFPILIYGAYNAKEREYRNLQKLTPEVASTYPAAPIGEKTPAFKNISFSNVTATAASGKRGGLIWGLPEMPVENVTMTNVRIESDYPLGIYFAKNVLLNECIFKSKNGTNQIQYCNADIVLNGKSLK